MIYIWTRLAQNQHLRRHFSDKILAKNFNNLRLGRRVSCIIQDLMVQDKELLNLALSKVTKAGINRLVRVWYVV
jgi:hypothetical protein